MSPVEAACREYECTYCGAAPGHPCKTISGYQTLISHASRWYAAKAAGRFDSL